MDGGAPDGQHGDQRGALGENPLPQNGGARGYGKPAAEHLTSHAHSRESDAVFVWLVMDPQNHGHRSLDGTDPLTWASPLLPRVQLQGVLESW